MIRNSSLIGFMAGIGACLLVLAGYSIGKQRAGQAERSVSKSKPSSHIVVKELDPVLPRSLAQGETPKAEPSLETSRSRYGGSSLTKTPNSSEDSPSPKASRRRRSRSRAVKRTMIAKRPARKSTRRYARLVKLSTPAPPSPSPIAALSKPQTRVRTRAARDTSELREEKVLTAARLDGRSKRRVLAKVHITRPSRGEESRSPARDVASVSSAPRERGTVSAWERYERVTKRGPRR